MSWFKSLLGIDRPQPIYGEGETIYGPADASEPAARDSLPSFRQRAGTFVRRPIGDATAGDARALMRDAFTPSQPVTRREMFAGRRELLEDLIVAIEDQRLHFVLYGDRGIGKTSILRILSELASDAGYLVRYVSCSEGLEFSDLAKRVAQGIPLLFHSDYEPGAPEIEQGLDLADILPKDKVDVPTFGDALSRLSGTRLLILLDEYDRVRSDSLHRSVAELIKNLSDNAAPAQLIVTGVASDLTELIAQVPSIRRNIVGVFVPNMTEQEAGEMLDKAEAKTGLHFTDGARELIFLASLGLPYLVGLVSQHAGFVATAEGKVAIERAAVRDAVHKARLDLSRRLSTKSRFAIERCTAEGDLMEYSQLAHAALNHGGVIAASLIPEKLRRVDEAALLEPIEDDPLARWRYIDDGAAIYIWLTALSEA